MPIPMPMPMPHRVERIVLQKPMRWALAQRTSVASLSAKCSKQACLRDPPFCLSRQFEPIVCLHWPGALQVVNEVLIPSPLGAGLPTTAQIIRVHQLLPLCDFSTPCRIVLISEFQRPLPLSLELCYPLINVNPF